MTDRVAKQYFCSWSGGKDSCLALYRAMENWGLPQVLFAMLSEGGIRSRSHGLRREVLQAQADAIGAAIAFESATWDDYEDTFIRWLRGAREEGIEAGVFGDIDLQEHREWERMVCRRAGMTAHLPLWGEDHGVLMQEFIAAGFEAIIVTVDTEKMAEKFIGRPLDRDCIGELRKAKIDPSAEAGEFHTLVTDGPIFDHGIEYAKGQIERIGQYVVLEIIQGGANDGA